MTRFLGVLLLRTSRIHSLLSGSTHRLLLLCGVVSAPLSNAFSRGGDENGFSASAFSLPATELSPATGDETTFAPCSCHCRMRSLTELESDSPSGLGDVASCRAGVTGALRRFFDERRGVAGLAGIASAAALNS
jgi:hypothetical protein